MYSPHCFTVPTFVCIPSKTRLMGRMAAEAVEANRRTHTLFIVGLGMCEADTESRGFIYKLVIRQSDTKTVDRDRRYV